MTSDVPIHEFIESTEIIETWLGERGEAREWRVIYGSHCEICYLRRDEHQLVEKGELPAMTTEKPKVYNLIPPVQKVRGLRAKIAKYFDTIPVFTQGGRMYFKDTNRATHQELMSYWNSFVAKPGGRLHGPLSNTGF